jgi:putative glutamine amidotransferase
MRKYLTIIIVLIIFSVSPAQSKTFKRIGIVNPTKGNLEHIVFLVQNDFIEIDSLQIVGVFHYSEKELLESAKRYVDDHSYNFISFEIINLDIPFDSLFNGNSCSSDFLRIFNDTDAMFFLGGADIPPKIYGEKTFLTTELISKGRNWELSFLYHLTGGFQNDSFKPFLEQRPDYLILGICLGMQEMNVASGGTLFQDIPYQIYGKISYDEISKLPMEKQHKNYWDRIDNWHDDISSLSFHHIRIAKNSFLAFGSLNRPPIVASAHHQSVKKLGKHYKMSATSMDKKVIEALSNTKFKNVYGIQFHPDVPVLYKDSTVFKVSPNNVTRLDMDSKQFYIDFWKDLCNKLYNQK